MKPYCKVLPAGATEKPRKLKT